jgi:hypothetical protein
MLFKFKSQAASDLIMLEADARRLLKIMLGHDPVKGIVQAQDIPAAVAALTLAVAQDEQNVAQRQTSFAEASEQDAPACAGGVRLSQRAAPMLQLLKRSAAENADVVWGV